MQTEKQHASLIFAHRGANKEAAENTRSAFNKALKYPIDGIETDVQLSRDGVPVLWHDWTLDKLGLPGKRIDDLDFSELECCNFASFYTPAIKAEKVLSLREFIDTYRDHCRLQIEVKSHHSDTPQRFQDKMRQCIDMVGLPQNEEIFISSFNLKCLIYAHQYDPRVPLYFALNKQQTLADIEFCLQAYPFLNGMCLHQEILNSAVVERLRDLNKGLLVYTCNTEQEINKALQLDVDVIISDYPEKALQLRT